MRQFLKHRLPKNTRTLLLRSERIIKLLIAPTVLIELYKYNKSKKLLNDKRFEANLKDAFPITHENTKYTSFDRHYVYHIAWAARAVQEIRANSLRQNLFKHTDISSSLYFCSQISAFIPVDFYDYRPANLHLSNLNAYQGDLMSLPFEDKSVESISCLHTIEHVGLGRYGDPIDAIGDTKAIKELMRVTAVGGNLLIVVPVGMQRIEFNAHRIYKPSYISDFVCATGEFALHEYAFIPETDEEGGLERNAPIVKGEQSRYACGCYWFVRIS